MIALLVAGAVFRSLGLPQLNYLLIAIFGVGALYAFLNPVHVVGVLLVTGGVGAVKGSMERAMPCSVMRSCSVGSSWPFSCRCCSSRSHPGDRSLGTSLTFLVLAPVAVLVVWLFGRVAPKVERAVFVVIPLGALLLAAANMLIPQRMLAAIGVPAWLRADRPQDEELARLETLIEKRRNEQRAAELRAISAKIEAGEKLTPADEAIVAAAQADRVTLTGWIAKKYDSALTDITERVEAQRQAAAGARQRQKRCAAPGVAHLPDRGWSLAVAVPSGYRVCARADRGERSYRAQCHLRGTPDGLWYAGEADRCEPAAIDRMRFRSRGRAQEVRYRYVAVAGSCAP